MNLLSPRKRTLRDYAVLALLVVTTGVIGTAASTESDSSFSPFVDNDGTIRFPGDVRDQWIHIGSWGSADLNSADPGHHDVYTQPGTVEAFRKTGKFPDGAVLLKEVRKIETAYMTTGPVTWAGDQVLWFMLVKDSKGRFPDNPNWGNGWGWALFNVGETEKNASSNFRASCLGCHTPAQNTDWVYVQGYPTLQAPYE
jgi:hypothetical protein